MSGFWCEHAWLGGAEVVSRVLIEIEGDRIRAVITGIDAPGYAERLPGIVIPGLANAHSHAFQRALRGRTQRARGSFWSWREQMYELAAAVDEERYESLARATFAEMALAGIAVVGEFDYLHHSEVLMRAAAAAGIRLTLLDTCYLDGGLPGFRDADADAWAERVGRLRAEPHVRLGAAIHSMRAVDPASAATVAAFAAARGWPLHAHVSEQPAENEQCVERYGATPTALLEDAGALSERFTAVHATHVSAFDRALLGSANACCCLCPTTERDLADGIGPARALRDAGAWLALGSDSHAVIDVFEEARAVELDERLATGVRGLHSAQDLLEAATAGGYRSLGWAEGGAIRSGALADFVSVRTDGVRLAGTADEDLLDAVVFASGAADVSDVVVSGRRIVADGAHVGIDVPRDLAAAIKEVGA
jgi:formiminoglutamate deiminase